jgi:hypothetical protein
MKIKTVLTGNVARTRTNKINQHNLNDQLKRSSTVLNQKLGSAQSIQTHTHTLALPRTSTTLSISCRNEILINKPKQNLDAYPSKPSC